MHKLRAFLAGLGARPVQDTHEDIGGMARPATARAGVAFVLLCLSACEIPDPPETPEYPEQKRIVWLDQGWRDEQRQWFHYVSQGTATIPVDYAHFMALEQPVFSIRSAGLFSDPEYLARFGFIRGQKDPRYNPDGLPIGFARNGNDLGLTCAACHTGQIDRNGTAIRIDGGAAHIDLDKFRKALALSIGLTERLPFRFQRFAERVLGPDRTPDQEKALKATLTTFIDRVETLKKIEAAQARGSVDEGIGRLDALNRIGNEVFGAQMGRGENVAPRRAPVAFPHLWGTGWFDWVQYNGSIMQPMVRNAGEALGVRAKANFLDPQSPLFDSTIPVDNLDKIERLLMGSHPLAKGKFTGLRSPSWPQHILGKIDPSLARAGADVYRDRCQSCHMPPVKSEAFWKKAPGSTDPPNHWRANDEGQLLLRMLMIPLRHIGTDPAQAEDMKKRTVLVPASLGLTGERESVGTFKKYGFADALKQIVAKVVGRWYDTQKPPTSPADRHRMNGERPNKVREGLPGPNETTIPAYKARPLDGIWATPPYLHNGSVPTLAELLLPAGQRKKTFYVGTREYFPEEVGYRYREERDKIDGGMMFDARIAGNSNKGHSFENYPDPRRRPDGVLGPELTPQERAALMEFLKTL